MCRRFVFFLLLQEPSQFANCFSIVKKGKNTTDRPTRRVLVPFSCLRGGGGRKEKEKKNLGGVPGVVVKWRRKHLFQSLDGEK